LNAPQTIAAVDVMTIQAQLPAPVIFGEWIMRHREFALVRVRSTRFFMVV